MTTAIVLIPVDYSNARDVINLIEGQTYKTTTALRIHLAQELIGESDPEVENGTEPKASDVSDVEIYDLSDFTVACNDQVVNIEGTYMCHVFFE